LQRLVFDTRVTEQMGLFDARIALPPGDDARGVTSFEGPPLQIRESRRARRLTLRMVPPRTLELVVPRGTRPALVAAFVHEQRNWIESARRKLASIQPVRSGTLPELIELPAIGERWAVRYEQPAAGRIGSRAADGVLEIRTREASPRSAVRQLRQWLLDQADYHLVPWLLRESAALGHRPANVQVRLQRTRWGSCSSRGTVSLNAALLFVEPAVVRYLFVHELCHLVALDHSAKFWAAVARHEPDYEGLDRKLSAAWSAIPPWAHPDAG
jgi:predicted metal-dependent hydrolase